MELDINTLDETERFTTYLNYILIRVQSTRKREF